MGITVTTSSPGVVRRGPSDSDGGLMGGTEVRGGVWGWTAGGGGLCWGRGLREPEIPFQVGKTHWS